MITFFRGHPTDNLLPRLKVLSAATKVLANPQPDEEDDATRHPLTYGPDEGALRVREQLAKWNNRVSHGTATADCLNLTNGASFGAAGALMQCTDPKFTRQAFIVSPTYFLINKVFKDAGFEGRMSAVEETDDGINLDELEKALELDKQQHGSEFGEKPSPEVFRYVLYVVPTFSNPGGHTLSLEQRKHLIEIARKYDLLVLCDEVYEWLDFSQDKTRPPVLVTLDRETLPEGSIGNVIANYTTSKILGPGLRVGWQEAATPQLAFHLSQSGAVISGGTPAHLNTFIVGELAQSGEIDEVIEDLNRIYGERAKGYREAMEKYLPKGTKIAGGEGGYFFWVTLPNRYDAEAITKACAGQKIILAPGQHFEVDGDPRGWGKHCFRVSLSYYDNKDAIPAIKKWGEICAEHYAK